MPESGADARAASDKPAGGAFARLFAPASRATPAKPAAKTRPKLPPPLARIRLAGGDIVVDPPSGYCIDPTTAQSRGQRGFALVASCRILSGGAVGRAVPPLVATVAVGPRGSADDLPTPGALASAAGSDVLGGARDAELVVAHLATGGDAGLKGGDDRYWRGAFIHAGRLVGLALYAPKGSALAGEDGAAMLQRIRAGIVARSDAAQSAAGTRAKPDKAGGFLNRLFNRQNLP